jgi:uncharacterized surface anchored protein
MIRKVIFASLLAVAVSVGAAVAQTSKGAVAGTVKDSSGAVIPGANVTIISENQGFSRSMTTDDSGAYFFEALQPGTYKIRVSAAGFSTVEVNKLEVRAA